MEILARDLPVHLNFTRGNDMTSQHFLKPAHKGLLVRDPLTKTALSEKGEIKPWVGKDGIYWRRRLRDGSVIIAEQKTVKQSSPPSNKQSEKKYGGKL